MYFSSIARTSVLTQRRLLRHWVLPWDMVDKSTSPFERIPGWFFYHWTVQTGFLFAEPSSIQLLLRPSSPLSPRQTTSLISGFGASQAETGGNGHKSTSRAVHRLFVLPAAMAGVHCR